MADGFESPLKSSFKEVREERNIDLVLPVFLKSTLYVVTAESESGTLDFFYTSSPQKGRYCVTVAENEETLRLVKWPKRKMTGLELIKELPKGIEVVITYPDGGDYIAREHLEWYRQQLPIQVGQPDAACYASFWGGYTTLTQNYTAHAAQVTQALEAKRLYDSRFLSL